MANTYSGPFGAGSSGGGSSFTPYRPTQQIITSGSGTYTSPSSPRTPIYIRVQGAGAGGGGQGSGQTGAGGASGTDGGDTTFSGPGGSFTAHGGKGGTITEAGLGGSCTITTSYSGVAFNGQNGGVNSGIFFNTGLAVSPSNLSPFLQGGNGGDSLFSGGGQSWKEINAVPNTGSGGAGGSIQTSSLTASVWNSGMGGGGGGWFDYLLSPGEYEYSIGLKGLGGAAGTGGDVGGDAADGILIITEYYQ